MSRNVRMCNCLDSISTFNFKNFINFARFINDSFFFKILLILFPFIQVIMHNSSIFISIFITSSLFRNNINKSFRYTTFIRKNINNNFNFVTLNNNFCFFWIRLNRTISCTTSTNSFQLIC